MDVSPTVVGLSILIALLIVILCYLADMPRRLGMNKEHRRLGINKEHRKHGTDMERLIVLKLRDYDPLAVDPNLLTENSPLFNRLINELHQTELDMDDFSPEIVGLFITLLDDKILNAIERAHFRELHKMAVVFEVSWMVAECRSWLEAELEEIDCESEEDSLMYLFEEARYILDKWKVRKYVHLFIEKLQYIKSPCIISGYISRYMGGVNFEGLTESQLLLMIQLSGLDTKVLLQILLRSLLDKESVHKNSKFLLQNLNLHLCLKQNDKLYHRIFDAILSRQRLSPEETKLFFKIHTESTKQYFSKESAPKATQTELLVKPTRYSKREREQENALFYELGIGLEQEQEDYPFYERGLDLEQEQLQEDNPFYERGLDLEQEQEDDAFYERGFQW